jgi:hypothetical protein
VATIRLVFLLPCNWSVFAVYLYYIFAGESMSPELDQKLCEEFPAIMSERRLGAMQTAMCWGFDHADGWYNLLHSAMRLVQSHIDVSKRIGVDIEPVVFEQVKEKFGILTIYHRGGDEYTRGVLRMAEEMSRHTCEECGDVGYPNSKGWIRTLCDEHHAKYGNN